MPTVTPKALVEGTLLAAIAPGMPGLYRVPLSGVIAATLRSIRLCNTSASSTITATVYLVASGDSEGAKSIIIPETTLGAKSFLPDDSIHVLGPGDYISAVASLAGVVSFRASGAEILE